MIWAHEDFEDLDGPATYAADPSGVYGWIETSDQRLSDAKSLYLGASRPPIERRDDIREVLICGMGGSAISGDIAYSVTSQSLPVPCRVVRGYTLPVSLGPGTLLIVVSYSGNTEESVWAYTQGHNRMANVVAIATGGALGDLADRHGTPLVKLPTDYPAPRLALPHLLCAVLSVLSAAFEGMEFIHESVEDAIVSLKRGANRYSRDLQYDKNFAKRLAYDIHGSFPVIAAAELTWPAALRFQAQINENSKWPCHACMIPEMNHNEVVAYAQAGPATGRTGILFLRDKDDHPRVKFRQDFTSDLVRKHVAWVHELKGEGKTLLGRLMSMMQTADYTSYYLACARGLDPLTIRAIDTLKERLGKIQ